MDIMDDINKNTLFSHILLNCPKKDIEPLISKKHGGDIDFCDVKVVITVEGHELTFGSFEDILQFFWDSMCRQFAEPEEERIKKAANDLINEKSGELWEMVSKMEEKLESLQTYMMMTDNQTFQ